jgi:hypothetical protein
MESIPEIAGDNPAVVQRDCFFCWQSTDMLSAVHHMTEPIEASTEYHHLAGDSCRLQSAVPSRVAPFPSAGYIHFPGIGNLQSALAPHVSSGYPS